MKIIRMPAEPNAPPRAEDRLDSWKEIAAYLRRGVRTVQRWERTDGLPVRRLGQEGQRAVFAYKSELDAWWQTHSRSLGAELEPTAAEAPDSSPGVPTGRKNRSVAIVAAFIFFCSDAAL